MFEFLILFILLVAIIVILVYGFFIKPAIDREKNFYDEEDYYDDGDEDEEELNIAGRGLKFPAKKVTLYRNSNCQTMLGIQINSNIPCELIPVSVGDKIVLTVDSSGIIVDHYYSSAKEDD